jgi:hypothetical protein
VRDESAAAPAELSPAVAADILVLPDLRDPVWS